MNNAYIGELEFQLEHFTGMRCTTIGKTEYHLEIALIQEFAENDTSVSYIIKVSTITMNVHIQHIIDINGMFNLQIYKRIQDGIDRFNQLYGNRKD